MTGEPAVRRVQWVSAEWLADMWRIAFKVDVVPSFRGTERFGLWESPTGLYFFHPPRAGDATFYETLYAKLDLAGHFAKHGGKAEFDLAARHVRKGDSVLDVGCASGRFRFAVPQARYVGLEPFPPAGPRPDWMVVASLEDHVAARPGAHDVACAFQVLEHVEDPVRMVRLMAKAVRPGGRVILGVPHVPCAGTRIPNYLINAAPHHITWWTAEALEAVAARAGLERATVIVAPWSKVDALIYWMGRCAPVKTGRKHYHHAWTWHASAAIAGALGYLAWRIRGAPRTADDEGASLLLVAEKPA